jgi:hypothetical protein
MADGSFGAERDFAAQVAVGVVARTGWIADAADEGARWFDALTGYVSAVDALIQGNSEGGVALALAFIPGPLDNAASGAFTYSAKTLRRMARRGWTKELVEEAVRTGNKVAAGNKVSGNPATRYIHPRTGQSVVVDNVTGEVIHVGGPGFRYGLDSGDLP